MIGFNELSKLCSPIQTVNMLSNIYHAFDGRLAKYDVYKIETIGHAYMVASGKGTMSMLDIITFFVAG